MLLGEAAHDLAAIGIKRFVIFDVKVQVGKLSRGKALQVLGEAMMPLLEERPVEIALVRHVGFLAWICLLGAKSLKQESFPR